MKTDWSLILQEGVIISIIVIVIVLAVMLVLYRIFSRRIQLLGENLRQKLHRQGKGNDDMRDETGEIPPEHSAAIAMALYLYNKVHDEESNILTIERKSRYYSPWSSKYYNMRKPIWHNHK